MGHSVLCRRTAIAAECQLRCCIQVPRQVGICAKWRGSGTRCAPNGQRPQAAGRQSQVLARCASRSCRAAIFGFCSGALSPPSLSPVPARVVRVARNCQQLWPAERSSQAIALLSVRCSSSPADDRVACAAINLSNRRKATTWRRDYAALAKNVPKSDVRSFMLTGFGTQASNPEIRYSAT